MSFLKRLSLGYYWDYLQPFFNSFVRQSFVIITIFSLIGRKIWKVNLLIKLSIVNILLFLYSFFIDLRMEEWYYFE